MSHPLPRLPSWSLLMRIAALLALMGGLKVAGIAARGDEDAGWNVLIYGLGGVVVISFMLGFLDGRYRTRASRDATWFLAAAAAALLAVPFWVLASINAGDMISNALVGAIPTGLMLAGVTSLPAVFGVALGGVRTSSR